MSLFCNFKKAISLILTFRMIDRIYSQNLNYQSWRSLWTNSYLSKFNLKLICRYYYYNHKLYKHLFKRLIFICDSNLKTMSLFKRSLSSNLFNYSWEFFNNITFKLYVSKHHYRYYHHYHYRNVSIVIYMHFINHYYQTLIFWNDLYKFYDRSHICIYNSKFFF